MKRITISVFLSALLLTGCSNQDQSNPIPETTTLSSESTTTTAETTKPEYPTRTINQIENVTVTVPELPDYPADSLQFIDCRREIEGREPQEYLQAYLKKSARIHTQKMQK